MKNWRKIGWTGILLGNGALLLDYFVVPIPHVLMIPVLLAALALIFTGFLMRNKQNTNRAA